MNLIFYFNKIKNTGILINSKKSQIRKFSSNNKSLALLRNEKNGYNWYLSQRRISQKNLKTEPTKKYPFLDFTLIKGKEVSYSSFLSENYDYTKKVLAYYKDFWPSKFITPSHGDLTFANIMFLKNRIEIIDWENFVSKKEWGYDISYFLISSLTLPFIIKKKTVIQNKELLIFEKLWKNFFKNSNFSYTHNPIKYIKNSVKSDNLRNYKKFFLNKLSGYQIDQIKEITN